MIQGFAAFCSSLNKNFEIVFDFLLANIFGQTLGPQRVFDFNVFFAGFRID